VLKKTNSALPIRTPGKSILKIKISKVGKIVACKVWLKYREYRLTKFANIVCIYLYYVRKKLPLWGRNWRESALATFSVIHQPRTQASCASLRLYARDCGQDAIRNLPTCPCTLARLARQQKSAWGRGWSYIQISPLQKAVFSITFYYQKFFETSIRCVS
jgi:hypothetical protein